MIEYNIESPSLPFIGHKSGPSKWLEDLSRDLMPLKSFYDLEASLHLFEESQINGILYPIQKPLISDRLFEVLYKSPYDKKSNGKAMLKGEKKDFETPVATPEITSFNFWTNTNINSPNIDLNEIEKAIPKDEKTKNKLVNEIIYRASEDIENVHIPENVKAVKEVLDHLYLNLKSSKSEKLVARKFLEEKPGASANIKDTNHPDGKNLNFTEDRSLNIKSSEFKDVLFEKIRNQFSKHIGNIPASKEFLEKRSEVPANNDDSNPPEEISLNFIEDYPVNKKESFLFSWDNVPGNDNERLLWTLKHDLDINWVENAEIRKSGDDKTIHIVKGKNSAKIEVDAKKDKGILKTSDDITLNLKVKKENGKLNIYKESINIISKNQFSKPIEGISVSKEFLEKKSRVSLHSSAIHSENEASSNTGSMQIDKRFNKDANPIIREPKESISESKNIPAAFNTLLEQVYSNYKNKIIIHEDNKKLFLNLIEKINQSVTQNFIESSPPNQNIFNIHIREDFATSEKDMQNLSDRLVLILKEQARRHGIDLS